MVGGGDQADDLDGLAAGLGDRPAQLGDRAAPGNSIQSGTAATLMVPGDALPAAGGDLSGGRHVDPGQG